MGRRAGRERATVHLPILPSATCRSQCNMRVVRLIAAGDRRRGRWRWRSSRVRTCTASRSSIRAADMQGTARRVGRSRYRRASRARRSSIPTRARTDARAAVRAGRPQRTRGAARLGPPSVGHRRAAARAAGAAACGERHRGGHAGHPGAVALRDHAARSPTSSRTRRGWLADRAGARAGSARSALMGISFSGGLSIVAAGRPSLRGPRRLRVRASAATTICRACCGICARDSEPSAEARCPAAAPRATATFVRAPHDYGVAVILLGARRPRRAAGAGRRRCATASGSTCRRRSSTAGRQGAGAGRVRGRSRRLARTLPEPSATLMRYVNDSRRRAPRARGCCRTSTSYGADAGAVVSKSPKPTAPVFLLHGIDDNVIPSIESEYLADGSCAGTHRCGCC